MRAVLVALEHGQTCIVPAVDAAAPLVLDSFQTCIAPDADAEINVEFAECSAAGPSKLSGCLVRFESRGLRPPLCEFGDVAYGGVRRR